MSLNYEPGTAAHFCEVVVVKLRSVPIGTALSLIIIRVIRRASCLAYQAHPGKVYFLSFSGK